MTEPRDTSTSSASVSVTDCPAIASSRSPFMVTMRETVLVLPDGTIRTGSPGFTVPDAMRPEKPRKSRLGRLTHCTGMVKDRPCAAVPDSSTFSRCSISAGPLYQGVLGEGAPSGSGVMLSPLNPEIGIAVKSVMPISVAKLR